MLASFGIYHLFSYNRRSFSTVIFGSIGVFFWVTTSHIATHCRSFNPASRRSSLNWLHNVVILNATIFIWPHCHNGSIVIWLNSLSGSVVLWPDSPSSSVDIRPWAGVISNLSWPGLNKHCTVTDMKGRTISLSHGWVIKATLDSLRTMSLAHGRVIKATFEDTKKHNRKCHQGTASLAHRRVI